MVRVVQRIASGRQQFNRLAYAARLVDGALFADGQVHRQVQKGVGLAAFHVVHFFKRRIGIVKVGVVLGVFGDPLAGEGFNRLHGLAGFGFGMHCTEKTADIGL